VTQFNVYTGDGNFGTSLDHTIKADLFDDAVAEYMDGVDPKHRDLFYREDEEHVTYLTVLDGPNGERAGNGAAYFICEIRAAGEDPRG